MPRVTNVQLSVWSSLWSAASSDVLSDLRPGTPNRKFVSAAYVIVKKLLEEVGALRFDLERLRRERRRVDTEGETYSDQAIRYAAALQEIAHLRTDCRCQLIASKALENVS